MPVNLRGLMVQGFSWSSFKVNSIRKIIFRCVKKRQHSEENFLGPLANFGVQKKANILLIGSPIRWNL